MDAATKLTGVVGHPIAHSLSPAIHNAALRHDKGNAVYLAFDVTPDDFATFIAGMRVAKARGVNLTIPHKRAAFEICDELGPEAQNAEAVNTIVFDGGRIVGHNTDVGGVQRALQDLGADATDATALVIGAGGAGRAAAWALQGTAKEVWVANRTAAKAEKLRSTLGRTARVVPWKELGAAAASVDVIVHATAVGIGGEGSVLDPYALQKAKQCRGILDLVYGLQETPLVREARRVGIPAADGLMMLVHQAALAYELFWDRLAPVDVMTQAARHGARRTD